MSATNTSQSLLHNLGRVYLRVSLTDRCNLQCRYCLPAEGLKLSKRSSIASYEELLRLIEVFNQIRPTYKVRITGGEPLIRPDVPFFVASLKTLLPEAELCITTNGILLPGIAVELKNAGIESVNISLDTVNNASFKELAGRDKLQETLAGLRAAREAGFLRVKVNTVLLKSYNGDQLAGLVKTAGEYGFEIRFIELMPFGVGAYLHPSDYLSAGDALDRLKETFDYRGAKGGNGISMGHILSDGEREYNIAFIQTMSAPFCAECNRLRFDCRGRLYSCLRDTIGLDLLTPLRDGDVEEIRARVRTTIHSKVIPEDVWKGAWPGKSMVGIGG